jgi:hypothetical protein
MQINISMILKAVQNCLAGCRHFCHSFAKRGWPTVARHQGCWSGGNFGMTFLDLLLIEWVLAVSLFASPFSIGKVVEQNKGLAGFNSDGHKERVCWKVLSASLAGDEAASQFALPEGRAPAHLWVLDVDHDGDLDLIVLTRSLQPLILLNNGQGDFFPYNPLCLSICRFHFAQYDCSENPPLLVWASPCGIAFPQWIFHLFLQPTRLSHESVLPILPRSPPIGA